MAYASGLLSDLLEEKRQNIYCFGAGKMFDDFVKEFSGYNLKDSIKAIADNHADSVRPSIKVVQGVSVPIISFEKLIKNVKGGDKILLTLAAYEEIIEQLEQTKELKDTDYYIYPVLRIDQYDHDRLNIRIPSNLSAYESIQIPRIIHYCWFGGEKIPTQYKKWMESWKRHCPDYEIIEWNERNYDVHKNRYISQAYESKKWAFVSDYLRIDIIGEYGGVYLDTDVELIQNLDELLMNDAFCGFESYDYVNYGSGFGARKNNAIVNEIREYCENREFVRGDGSFDQTTSPIIQTEIMLKHGLKCNGEFQVVDGMAVYPSRVLCGMSPHSFRIEKDLTDTYAIHHFSGSWVEDKKGKGEFISAMKKWSRNDYYIYPGL